MRIKKMNRVVSQTLQTVVDHTLVRQTVEAARVCDQAVDYGSQGQYEEALQLVFPLILQEVPILSKRARKIAVWALEYLVDECEKREDFAQALEYLNQWLYLRPDDLAAMIIKGELLLDEMENLEEAAETFRAALKKYPNSIEALIGLARIDTYNKRYHLAIRRLAKAWKVMAHSEWGYPRYEAVVINVLETLYKFTSYLMEISGNKHGAKEVTLQAIEVLGGHSEYLQEYLASLNDNRQEHSRDVEE